MISELGIFRPKNTKKWYSPHLFIEHVLTGIKSVYAQACNENYVFGKISGENSAPFKGTEYMKLK